MKKKIFCTFCVVVVAFFPVGTEENLDWKTSLVSGVSLNEKYIDARVYSELEKEALGELTYGLKTWGIKGCLFDCLSLGFGNLAVSGVWSKFNNPCPSSLDSLKEPFAISRILKTDLPNSSSVNDSVISSMDLNLPVFQLNGYIEGLSEITEAGFGCSFKYTKTDYFSLQTTTAWQMASINSKVEDGWFLENKYFKPQKKHALIQEISFKFAHFVTMLHGGVNQTPFGEWAWFIRSENSITVLPFLINFQGFFSSENCINFDFNPQLRFAFDTNSIRELKVGFSVNAKFEKPEKFYLPAEWCYAYCGAVNIAFETIAVALESEFSEEFSTSFNFLLEPNWGPTFNRNWGFDCKYSKAVDDKEDFGKIELQNFFDAKFAQNFKHKVAAGIYAESLFDLNQNVVQPTITLGGSSSLELNAEFLKNTQTLSIKAAMDFTLQEKKPAKLNADFSVILSL